MRSVADVKGVEQCFVGKESKKASVRLEHGKRSYENAEVGRKTYKWSRNGGEAVGTVLEFIGTHPGWLINRHIAHIFLSFKI